MRQPAMAFPSTAPRAYGNPLNNVAAVISTFFLFYMLLGDTMPPAQQVATGTAPGMQYGNAATA